MDALWLALGLSAGPGIPPHRPAGAGRLLVAGFVLNALRPARQYAARPYCSCGILLLLFSRGLKLAAPKSGPTRCLGRRACCIWRSAVCRWAWVRGGRHFAGVAGIVAGHHPGLFSTVLAAKALEERRNCAPPFTAGCDWHPDHSGFGGAGADGGLWRGGALAVGAAGAGLPLLRPVVMKILDWSGHDELAGAVRAGAGAGGCGLGLSMWDSVSNWERCCWRVAGRPSQGDGTVPVGVGAQGGIAGRLFSAIA